MLPNTISQDRAKNWSSLHDAAANGDEVMLKTLLAGHADATLKELKLGNTALHEAASRGYSRSVKILCASNVNKTHGAKDKRRGEAHKDASGIVRASTLSIQNHAGFTALHLAAQNGHNQSCREILLAGANPDIENYYGDTALHTACRYGHAGAARILISAFCDVNKRNLNGDTPLHITSAMGRHKLSRILLEADCDINVHNAQNETPRDIATRKGFAKILDILDNPHRIRNRHTKQTTGDEEKTKCATSHNKGVMDQDKISWSPYGCHYFPDPRSFPSPKLETLPKEPLKRGEQYYLDLAGHIRKGPIGIGNICYCGPFFKHIEDKINSNKRQLRKYVHNAKEHLDDKVQALAARTNHQIEKLTRTMIADRVQCENRRIYLENYLKRGDPLRLTADVTTRRKQTQDVIDGTLKRCRSLELLEKDDSSRNRLANSRSCELLEETSEIDNPCRCDAEYMVQIDKANPLKDDVDDEFYDVSKRLGNLLAKTSTFLKDPENKQSKCDTPAETNEIVRKNIELREVHAESNSSRFNSAINYNLNLQSTSANEASISPGSNLSNELDTYDIDSIEFEPSHNNGTKADIQYLYDIQRRGNVIQNVISALRKSHQKIDSTVDTTTHNDTEYTQEDKLGYKGEKSLINSNGLFQLGQSDLHKSNARLEEVGLPVFPTSKDTVQINEYTRMYKQSLSSPRKDHNSLFQPSPGEFEETRSLSKNSEEVVKTTTFGVEGAVTQYEVLYSGSQSSENDHLKINSPIKKVSHSDTKQSLTSNSTSSPSTMFEDTPQLNIQNNYWSERFIPKDAYFHDIKVKSNPLTDGPISHKSGMMQNIVDFKNKTIKKPQHPQFVCNQYVHHAKLLPTVSSIANVKSFNKMSPTTDDPHCNYTHQVHSRVNIQSDFAEGSRQRFPYIQKKECGLVQPTDIKSIESGNIIPTVPSSLALQPPNQKPSYGYGSDLGMLNGQSKLSTSVYYASNVSSLV